MKATGESSQQFTERFFRKSHINHTRAELVDQMARLQGRLSWATLEIIKLRDALAVAEARNQNPEQPAAPAKEFACKVS